MKTIFILMSLFGLAVLPCTTAAQEYDRSDEQEREWDGVEQEIKSKRKEIVDWYYALPESTRREPETSDEMELKFERLNEMRAERALDMLKRNPGSPFSLNVLYREAVGANPQYEFAEQVFGYLTEELRSSPQAEPVKRQLMELKKWLGADAPDFTLYDPHGVAVTLSDLRGRYVLLDFWASWCGPCRAENPHISEAYASLAGNGFTVVGVSLDRNDEKGRQAWLKAVEEDNVAWTQVIDNADTGSRVADLYEVVTIPANFLIDPQGRIVAKNIRGRKLTSEIERYIPSGKQ